MEVNMMEEQISDSENKSLFKLAGIAALLVMSANQLDGINLPLH